MIDRSTGMSQGVAVPEADRDKNKGPIYHQKKTAVEAIPIVDSEGNEMIDGQKSYANRSSIEHLFKS